MSDELMKSFGAFEAERGNGFKCHVCRLEPELVSTVNALLLQGRSPVLVRAWLESLGHPVSIDSMHSHKKRRHSERIPQQR